MSLTQWRENGWLVPHEATPDQVCRLLAMADRDLAVAAEVNDIDWSFGIAYNAALKLCTVLLYASGYRAARELHHHRSLIALPLILGSERHADASYLDQCRMKRNQVEYEIVGAVSRSEARELTEFAQGLRAEVIAWLRATRPDLLPGS